MFLDAITFDAFISLKMCYHNASTMHQQCVNNVSIRYNIETIKVLLGMHDGSWIYVKITGKISAVGNMV